MDKAYDLLNSQQYSKAIQLLEKGAAKARRDGDPLFESWCLNSLAPAYFSMGEYRLALDHYIEARDRALQAGLREQAALAMTGLSSLYMHVFDTTSALYAARRAREVWPANANPEDRLGMLLQLGRILMVRNESAEALPIFSEVLADPAISDQQEAEAMDQAGLGLLRIGDLEHAEAVLNNAFRIRRLTPGHPNLLVAEYGLAELHLLRGNNELALHLIDAALVRPNPVRVPLHLLYGTRARVLRRLGRTLEAMEEYLHAVDAAEEWRNRGLSADQFRIGTDALLDQLYDEAIATAVQLYHESGDRRYAVLSWQLNEAIRAASLRYALGGDRDWTRRVPAEYWTTLERLRHIETGLLILRQDPPPDQAEESARLRMHLAEMEARAGIHSANISAAPSNEGAGESTHLTHMKNVSFAESFFHRISLTHFRKVLGNSRTLIAFHLGQEVSCRWVVTQEGLDLKMLPPKQEVATIVTKVRSNSDTLRAESAADSRRLYGLLFGGIPERSKGWLVALDGPLYDIPLPALVADEQDGQPVFMIERRSAEVVPGAWAVEDARRFVPGSGFLGIADGVYNVADSRYPKPSLSNLRSLGSALLCSRVAAESSLQLPRLIASRREVEECAHRAAKRSTLLMGAEVTRPAISAALAQNPEIIHIAAHFLSGPSGRNTAVALGLARGRDGRPQLDLLTAEDIAGLRVPGSIVVMSGCSSGAGRVAPAAGLLGLSRAWLVAGASAVIATQWATPDDTGELFAKFYEHLRDSDGLDRRIPPAEALRRAQVDMLRSGTWRAEPAYWAAYQTFGRSN